MTAKNNFSVSADQAPLTTEKPETKAGTPGEIVKAIFRWEASGVLVALILLCTLLAIASPNFLTPFNLTVVIREASFVGLVALGQTLVLLLGGIDLSVGAAAGLSAIVGCLFLKSLGIPPWLVIPATAVFGLCIGSISGFFVSVLKLNPFIVTLAMWEIFAGMTLVITKGYPIRPLGPAFTMYGQGEIFGIPGPVLLFLVAAAVLVWVLSKTRFGRNLYAIGQRQLGVKREDCYVVGDAVWDMLAARRAAMLCIGLLTGGYGAAELVEAGAFRVYRDAADLHQSLDEIGIP